MWPFKRNKKAKSELQNASPRCTVCGSTNTRLVMYHGTGEPGYVKVWRGQRASTCRCLDCGADFYVAEPPIEIAGELIDDDRMIDDEEALRAAEEEIQRQIEEEDDRRCF